MNTLAFLLLFQFASVLDQTLEFTQSSLLPNSQLTQKSDKAVAANIIFKSTDGGQTWQDISAGLPANLQEEGIERNGFVEKDSELYISTENGIYHSQSNATAPYWQKASLISTVSEMLGGTNRLFDGGGAMKSVEANGVLLATSQKGIIRSTDAGETWDLVISEGGVGIAVERIKGGFAAITYNTESETRRVRTSYDGGKTWQPIDAGLPASLSIASIVQVGEDLFCGHPTGIFRSSDQGKTWQLLLPAIGDKVFNLSVSGNVIYAILRSGGC
ncbi:sialidase family protein [Salmonirosea aquatica]|uniref:Exo-alpha-sialidase n=1 Tax=Salmonirosea aquatica TaxID=2654236 RepID=A0A7C9FZF2_9BACT|nr:exo-alpha-sialidase [Cytophagaceae bacterium SJW1-29]